MAELRNPNGGTAEISNALAAVQQGKATLTDITIDSAPGDIVALRISVPTLDITPVDIDIVLEECPRGTSETETAQGNVICNSCKSGEYEKSGACNICPTQVDCDEGSTVSDWKLKAGNWRTDDQSDDVRKCRFGVISCPGDGKNQASKNAPSKRRVTSSSAAELNPFCSANHVGHLCSACAPDYFLSWAGDGKCHRCVAGESHAPTFGLLGGVFLCVVSCFACMYKAGQKKAKRTAVGTPTISLLSKAEQVYSQAKFKIFTLFYSFLEILIF